MDSRQNTCLIVYHSADLDGHCSGALVALAPRFQGMKIYWCGLDYGDEFEYEYNPTWFDYIVMVDFGLQPRERMQKFIDLCGDKLIWIDHHKSTIKEFPAWDGAGILKDGEAACELTWDFFYTSGRPLWITLLGRYDVWDKSREDWGSAIIPFQYGMRNHVTDPAQDIFFWEDMMSGILSTQYFLNEGSIILSYEDKQNEKLAKTNGFDVLFEGHPAIAVNFGGSSRKFQSVYNPEKHDLMIGFYNVRGQFWSVGLYSTHDHVDCSVIAKANGGGGHKGAAGFQCKDISFENGGRKVMRIIKK